MRIAVGDDSKFAWQSVRISVCVGKALTLSGQSYHLHCHRPFLIMFTDTSSLVFVFACSSPVILYDLMRPHDCNEDGSTGPDIPNKAGDSLRLNKVFLDWKSSSYSAKYQP